MGYTVREQILRAIGTAIGTGYPSELKQAPSRCRLEPFTDAELPALNWHPVSETSESPLGSMNLIQTRRLTVQFDVHVDSLPASVSYPSLDSRADTVMAFLSTKLAGSRLGGLALQVLETGATWTFDEASQDRAVVSVTYEVWYKTQTSNQEAK